MAWYSHFFKNFPQFVVIHTVKDFGIVNKAEIDVFLELSCLIFLPAILIPVCASSSPAFSMVRSAYKLNEQGDSIQPCYTLFPILNQSVVPFPVLTCFLTCIQVLGDRQVGWSGIPISLRIFQFVVIHTVQV